MLFVYKGGTFKYNTLSYKYIIYYLISIYVHLDNHTHSYKYTISIYSMFKKYFSNYNYTRVGARIKEKREK